MKTNPSTVLTVTERKAARLALAYGMTGVEFKGWLAKQHAGKNKPPANHPWRRKAHIEVQEAAREKMPAKTGPRKKRKS